jgi:plasmid stability protein
MVVNIPDDAADLLRAAAADRGVSPDELAAEVLVQHLPPRPHSTPRRKLALAAIGGSGTGLTHRIDEMLADGFGK